MGAGGACTIKFTKIKIKAKSQGEDGLNQCFGYRSEWQPDSLGPAGPDPVWESGSRQAKIFP
jgi:hypothetical protein